MALELIATGVEFYTGDAAGTEVFTLLPGVVGVPNFPALDPAVIDVTALDSAGVEKIIGLGDLGQMQITLNMRKKSSGAGWNAQQQVVEGYAGDGVLRGFRIIVKNTGTTLRTYNWKGFVKSFVLSAPSANSAITATLTIENSGAVTVS